MASVRTAVDDATARYTGQEFLTRSRRGGSFAGPVGSLGVLRRLNRLKCCLISTHRGMAGGGLLGGDVDEDPRVAQHGHVAEHQPPEADLLGRLVGGPRRPQHGFLQLDLLGALLGKGHLHNLVTKAWKSRTIEPRTLREQPANRPRAGRAWCATIALGVAHELRRSQKKLVTSGARLDTHLQGAKVKSASTSASPPAQLAGARTDPSKGRFFPWRLRRGLGIKCRRLPVAKLNYAVDGSEDSS